MKIINAKCVGQWGVATVGNTNTFYIEAEDFGILIDCGASTVQELKNRDIAIERISHIFVSHCHADHMAGFSNFVFLRTVFARLNQFELPALKVIANAQTIEAAKSMLLANYPDREFDVNYLEASSGNSIDEAGLNWYFTSCNHNVPTNGLIIRAENASFGYTADTAPSDKIFNQYHDVDLLAVECFGSDEHFGPIAKAQLHLTDSQTKELLDISKPRATMLFHLHARYANKKALLQLTSGLLSKSEMAGLLNEHQEHSF